MNDANQRGVSLSEIGRLQGNSVLMPMQYSSVTGEAIGFDIVNPSNSVVHIDLSQYSKKEGNILTNHHIRQSLYEKYSFLVDNVPAATAVFESNANTYPRGFVFKDADDKNVFTTIGYKKNGEPAKQLPVTITGNLLTEDRVYLGKVDLQHPLLATGGVWYHYLPEEVLLHEHCHASYELQDWTSHSIQDYKEALNHKLVPEREIVPIDLVNETMRKPRGQALRDATDYFSSQFPSNGVHGDDAAMSIDALRHGPIPDALKHYSHPKVNGLHSQSKGADSHDFIDKAGSLHPLAMAQLKFELSAFDSAHQQNFVFSRISDVINNHKKLKNSDTFHSDLAF